MKTRKVLFSLSAIALSLYTIWEIVRQLPLFKSWYIDYILGTPIRVELFYLPYTWLFFGGILLALIAALVKVNEEESNTKAYRYNTFVLSILAFFVTGLAVEHAVQVCGVVFLYAPEEWNLVIDIAGGAWLWMIAISPSNLQLPKSLRSLIGLAIGLVGLLFVLQLASGISYLTTGNILMFHTHAIGNWLRYLVPTILLCSYSLLLLKKWPSLKCSQIRQTRNSHCAPGSLMEKIYPFMRVISLASVGLAFVAFYFIVIWMNISTFHDHSMFAWSCFAAFAGLSWALLTFMAFFQLPNPRGYKIFNWIFFCLNWCFPIGLFLSIRYESNELIETIGVVIGVIGFFAFAFYLLYTSVRAILYTFKR